LGLSVTGKYIIYNGKKRRKNRALRDSLCLLDQPVIVPNLLKGSLYVEKESEVVSV
jgi:hypothetical protein